MRVLEELLRHRHATRRQRRVPGGRLAHTLLEPVRRPDVRDEAPAERLVGAESPIRHHPLESAREAEEPVDEPRAAGVGDEPDPDEAGDERRLIDAMRTSHAHASESPAPAHAVDRRDHRLLERGSRGCSGGTSARAPRARRRKLLELAQVLPEQNPRPAPVITTARTSGSAASRVRREPVVHRPVDRVVDVRPVEGDGQDGAVAMSEHLVGHGRGLLSAPH